MKGNTMTEKQKSKYGPVHVTGRAYMVHLPDRAVFATVQSAGATQAIADRDELVCRWNAHDDMLAILTRIIDRATAPMSNGDIDWDDVAAARAAIARAGGGGEA